MALEYAEAVRRHLQQHRPGLYAELMRDPEAGERHLARMGVQIADRLAIVRRQLLDSAAVASTLTADQRESQAQAIAEELVFSELLWTPDEETQGAVGPTGGYEGWEPGSEPLFEDLPMFLAR